MISSRKQKNVDKAIEELQAEKLSVSGTVCHVSNPEHRKDLIEKVSITLFMCQSMYMPSMRAPTVVCRA